MSGKPGLYRSYACEGEIPPYRMAKFGAGDNSAACAVSGAAFICGVTQIVGGVNGQQVDICRNVLPEVQYGAAVTKGNRLTADADGKAIPAVAGDWFLGYAEVDGVEDDIGQIFISPGKM